MNHEQKLARAKRRMLESFEVLSNGCWQMTKNLGARNSAQVMVDGDVIYVHRFLYELLVGPIPYGYILDHECHNKAAKRGECEGGLVCEHRRCVNPWHMAPKPQGDNLLASPLTEAAKNKAKTERKRGHPFDEENTRIKKNGWRSCKACDRMTPKERREWDEEHGLV